MLAISSFVGVAHLPGEEQSRMDMASTQVSLATATVTLSFPLVALITPFKDSRIRHNVELLQRSTMWVHARSHTPTHGRNRQGSLVCGVRRKRRVAVGALLFYSAVMSVKFHRRSKISIFISLITLDIRKLKQMNSIWFHDMFLR